VDLICRRTLEHLDLHFQTRVARWHIFKPKIPIWINFRGFCNVWYIKCPYGLFYGNWVYFVDIRDILGHLVYFNCHLVNFYVVPRKIWQPCSNLFFFFPDFFSPCDDAHLIRPDFVPKRWNSSARKWSRQVASVFFGSTVRGRTNEDQTNKDRTSEDQIFRG
jgi:hypothetical protein